MSTPASSRTTPDAPGTARARLRRGAVVLLCLVAGLYLVLAVRVYFFPSGSAVAASIVGTMFGVAALVYALLARAVARQSRRGHLLAVLVCTVGAVLAISVAMAWPDWATLVANAAAVGLLLASLPRRAPVAG